MTAADFIKIAQEKLRLDSETLRKNWPLRHDLCPICSEPLTSDDFKQDKVIKLAPDEFAHTRCWEAND